MIRLLRDKLDVLVMGALTFGVGLTAWLGGGRHLATTAADVKYLCLLSLTAATIATLWAYRRTISRSIRLLRRQLDDVNDTDTTGQLLMDRAPSLGQETRPLNDSLGQMIQQCERLRQTNRTLSVRGRIADDRIQQFEQVLKLVSDAVLITNNYDEIVFANGTAEQLLGFQLVTARRKNIDEVLDDGALIRHLRDARRQGLNQPRRIVEHTFVSNQPHTFAVMLHGLTRPNGKLHGVLMILRDITREKQFEQNKNEFLSNVSHELKTPLSSIKAYTEMLLDGEVEDVAQMREFHQTIAGEAERLDRMIERILNMSRVESGAARVVREPVSMTAVARQVMGVIAPQAKAKNLTVHEKLPPVYYQVVADYDMICQAVLNLLTNAVKYTPEGGTITFAVSVDDRRGVAVVEVSDSGIGIPPEEFPHIFEKFYRVRANVKMAPGTGLGLPLVKYIIETVHDGQLSVASEPGKGSTFSFELPLMQ